MSEPPEESCSFWSLFNEVHEPTSESEAPPLSDLLGEIGAPPPSQDWPPNCAVQFDPNYCFWAMRNLPVGEAAKHLLVCGCTGSGKTIAIQLYLQSIAERFKPGVADPAAPEQLILFDAKSDLMPLLAGLGFLPEEDIWLINPYDARSAVWNLAEAVQTPTMARSLAALLVPEDRQSSAPYFADAARELVTAVILGLNRVAETTWTFRDLLCALDSRDHIARVAAQDPRGGVLANRILSDERHSGGVLSTLGTKVGPFEQAAALWANNTTGRPFSIRKFLDRPGVLVLGNDPVLRSSFWPINAILLKALSQEILRRPNVRPPHHPRHWFVLDEFRAMERVDCIHDLLNRGRSKGVSMLLGIQSIEGLREVYGPAGAEDLLSQCANKVFLRAGGPETAEWAERFFGKVRQMEKSTSKTRATLSNSESEQWALQERSLFLSSPFMDLPLPGPGGVYKAICDIPCTGEARIVARHFDEIIQWCMPPASEEVVPAVIPRDDPDAQSLSPWTPTEEKRYCLPLDPTDATNKTGLPSRHET